MTNLNDISFQGLIIDTGNLINCNDLKRNPSQSPSNEVIESMTSTVSKCLQSTDLSQPLQNGYLIMKHPSQTKIESYERKDLKLTVKVFLVEYDSNLLLESIKQVMLNLNVDVLDSLILGLSSPQPKSTKSILEDLGPLWRTLENLVENERSIVSIGVSDLDAQELEELYEWANVKPTVNQVNLESCCVMPPQMTAFAKEKDIQLLTHSDPKVLLTAEALNNALGPILNLSENVSWHPEWIARYSAIVKCRGIIQNRGYVMAARKTGS